MYCLSAKRKTVIGWPRVVAWPPWKARHNKKQTVKAGHLLVAAGRRPNLAELNLELANIEYTQRGIVVDRFLKTSNNRVLAIGDCIGG